MLLRSQSARDTVRGAAEDRRMGDTVYEIKERIVQYL